MKWASGERERERERERESGFVSVTMGSNVHPRDTRITEMPAHVNLVRESRLVCLLSLFTGIHSVRDGDKSKCRFCKSIKSTIRWSMRRARQISPQHNIRATEGVHVHADDTRNGIKTCPAGSRFLRRGEAGFVNHSRERGFWVSLQMNPFNES